MRASRLSDRGRQSRYIAFLQHRVPRMHRGGRLKSRRRERRDWWVYPPSSSRIFSIECWADDVIFNPRASAAEMAVVGALCSLISRVSEEGKWRMGTTIRNLLMASSALRSRGLLMPGRGKLFLVASDLFRMAFSCCIVAFFPICLVYSWLPIFWFLISLFACLFTPLTSPGTEYCRECHEFQFLFVLLCRGVWVKLH